MWVGENRVLGADLLAAFIYDLTYCKAGDPKVREIRPRLLQQGIERSEHFRAALFKGFNDRGSPNAYRF